MKKFLTVLAIFVLVFTGCPTEDETTAEDSTTLKISNQSFTEITDVMWQNVPFYTNQSEKSIKSGTNATNNVEAGAGYVFFKRKSNPITARTSDLVVIERNQTKEFTFTDNTVIVEVGNTANTGSLGSLPNTVVWWDDAEGEMQPYYEARSVVRYYSSYVDLGTSAVYLPKNGNKSIAVGETYAAMLHLRINLTKNAKLSFWYANKRRSNSTGSTFFKLNGSTERTWKTDVNWSFMTVDLEAGENDIVWEKTDGFYLSLDDILIYYTE